MADRVKKVSYCHVQVPNRAGKGLEVLEALNEAGVNLLTYSGFPGKPRMAQIDLFPEDMTALKRVAREHGWRLSKGKKAFLITGNDRVGAVIRHHRKLADRKINVVAAQAVSGGKGRYGMILWVRPKDYNRAARALGAK